MSSYRVTTAASTFDATFWLGIAGVLTTLAGGLLGGYLTYRYSKSVAESTAKSQLDLKAAEASSQLDLKKEEMRGQIDLRKEDESITGRGQKRAEKVAAIGNFIDAADAYWQMINEVWDRVKRSEPLESFRKETGPTVTALTRTKVKLELVSSAELREAADVYVNALVESAKSVIQDKSWKPLDKTLRENVMDRSRDELGYAGL